MSVILPFKSKNIPYVVLDFCTVTQSDEFPPGSSVFRLEYREGKLAETLLICASYKTALKAANTWQADGVRLVDKTGGRN